jgi:hypothetical protein
MLQPGHLLQGEVLGPEPAPASIQGSLSGATIAWSDQGRVVTAGALDMAVSHAVPTGSVYIIGLNHNVYLFNRSSNSWTPTGTAEVLFEQIGWSPSRQTIWGLAIDGTPYEGTPQSDGTLLWSTRVAGTGTHLPWCGPSPTLSSTDCTLSIGGNAQATWIPEQQNDFISQWNDGTGASWATNAASTTDLLADAAGGANPGIVKLIEGDGLGPSSANTIDMFWFRSSTGGLWSFELPCGSAATPWNNSPGALYVTAAHQGEWAERYFNGGCFMGTYSRPITLFNVTEYRWVQSTLACPTQVRLCGVPQ